MVWYFGSKWSLAVQTVINFSVIPFTIFFLRIEGHGDCKKRISIMASNIYSPVVFQDILFKYHIEETSNFPITTSYSCTLFIWEVYTINFNKIKNIYHNYWWYLREKVVLKYASIIYYRNDSKRQFEYIGFIMNFECKLMKN